MPTYEYQCKSCGYTLEEFHSITEPPLTHCPRCDTENLVRVIGGGAGLIFKGTGFYLTDYKKSSSSLKHEEKPAGTSEKKKESSPPGGSPSSTTTKQ